MSAGFEAMIEPSIAKCTTLSPTEAHHFVEHGWVVVKGAFSKQIAADVVACAWRELEEKGIMQDDPETWKLGPYTRTGGPPNVNIMASRGDREAAAQIREVRTRYGLPPESPLLHDVAPRALGAQLDCVGGWDRVKDPELIKLPDSVAVNLCEDEDPGEDGWKSTRAPGWHKDGWQFRHFLDAPQQGLLLAFFYSDVLPDSGGTQICVDSVGVVARLLAQHPEGIHPDSVTSYIHPHMVEECREFEELAGEAGDMAIMHPYMVHRKAANPSGRARFASFPSIRLSQPMQFGRDDQSEYSLTELIVLKELGQLKRFDFATQADYETYPREDITPRPSRTEEERLAIGVELYEEQQRMTRTEPEWAQEMWTKREPPDVPKI